MLGQGRRREGNTKINKALTLNLRSSLLLEDTHSVGTHCNTVGCKLQEARNKVNRGIENGAISSDFQQVTF